MTKGTCPSRSGALIAVKNPRAQNVSQVTECVGALISRLVPLLVGDQMLLVLGGTARSWSE